MTIARVKMEMAQKLAAYEAAIPFERLEEAYELLRQKDAGLVAILPYKMNSEVFSVHDNEIMIYKVAGHQMTALGRRILFEKRPGEFRSIPEEAIDKTLFLTREEAEAALEQQRKLPPEPVRDKKVQFKPPKRQEKRTQPPETVPKQQAKPVQEQKKTSEPPQKAGPFEKVGMDRKVNNVLITHGVKTVEALLEMDYKGFMGIKNLDSPPGRREGVLKVLEEHGFNCDHLKIQLKK